MIRDMFQELQRHDEALIATIREYRDICNAPNPDHGALAKGRWKLAQISRDRTHHLMAIGFPTLEATADRGAMAALTRMRTAMNDHRVIVSSFIQRWPLDTVMQDWDRYRREVFDFLADILRWQKEDHRTLSTIARAT